MIGRFSKSPWRELRQTIWLIHPRTGEVQSLSTECYVRLASTDPRLKWFVAANELEAALRGARIPKQTLN